MTGKALISSESCIHSLSGNGDTGMQKMGKWHFSFAVPWSLCLNSLLVGLLNFGIFVGLVKVPLFGARVQNPLKDRCKSGR